MSGAELNQDFSGPMDQAEIDGIIDMYSPRSQRHLESCQRQEQASPERGEPATNPSRAPEPVATGEATPKPAVPTEVPTTSLQTLQADIFQAETHFEHVLDDIEEAQCELADLSIKTETIEAILAEIREATEELSRTGVTPEARQLPVHDHRSSVTQYMMTRRIHERHATISQQLHQCTLDGVELVVVQVQHRSATVATHIKETEARLSQAMAQKADVETTLTRLKKLYHQRGYD